MEINLTPTLKQHQVYEALKDPTVDEVFFGGGAGGGKSWIICESRLINCYLYPGYRSFIAREELKRLMESTYVTWTKVCQHHKIPKTDWKLNGQYNYIEFLNGSRIDLLDVKFLPSDPLYERFGSIEFSDGAIEETGEIHPLAREVLKSRINRHLNRELGIKENLLDTGNPKKNWTYQVFYKPYKENTLPSNMRFIQALYNDNPFTAENYGETLSRITDKAMKERLMFGNWEYDDDPSALIEYDSIVDMFTNTVNIGEKYISADVARYGQDKTVTYLWEGLEVTKQWTRQKQGIDQTIEFLKGLSEEERVPYSHIVVDEDGVGGGVVDGMRGIRGFVANSTPIEQNDIKQNYKNLKSQCYYLLADRINNHQVAVRISDDSIRALLIEELEQVKSKDADSDSKLQIIPKEQVKELLGRSPDYSDTLMMRMIFELKQPESDRVVIHRQNINQPSILHKFNNNTSI